MGAEELASEYRSKSRRSRYFTLLLVSVAAVVAVYSICVTQYDISFSEATEIVRRHLKHIPADSGYIAWLKDGIVWDSLVPRSMAGLLVGAILAVGGAIMQIVVKNPLADPYTTGISSGALLGVTLFVIFGFSAIPGLAGDAGMSVMAFIFALIPCALIYFVSTVRKVTSTMMILIGIAVMYIFNAAVTLLKYTASDEQVSEIYSWSVGTLGKCGWGDLPLLLAAFVVIFIFSMAASRILNVMSSDDKFVQSLGINASHTRMLGMGVVSAATAVAVCYTGTIGFVGLVAPHIARVFVGSNARLLMPASAAVGAFMLITADSIARVIVSVGVPVGVITSLVGGPIFIYILLRHHKRVWN